MTVHAPADFNKWARRDTWHIAEGAMLILGLEPFEIKADWYPPRPPAPGYLDIYETARRSRRLTAEGQEVSPPDFLAWAREKKYPVPPELEEAVNQFPPKAEHRPQGETSDAPLHESERDSLLRMVLGMAMSKYDYKPGAPRNPATGGNRDSISADLGRLGMPLDADTVRKFIKEAETRFKDTISNPQKPLGR